MKNIELRNMQDKSNLSKEEKDLIVHETSTKCMKELMTVFKELGLKSHIECTCVNDVIVDSFLLRLTKL